MTMYDATTLRIAQALSNVTKAELQPNAQAIHGLNGALTYPAIEPGIVNMMPSARQGLDAVLAVRSSDKIDPMFAVLSGLTESTGANPTVPCEPGREPGNWTFCTQMFPWGRMVATSKVIQVDQVAWRLNRGDFVDHRLMGNPFAQAPTVQPISTQDPLRNVVDSEMAKLYYAFYRDNAYMTHSGDYAAYQLAVGGSTGHYEYDGLDKIIGTGKRDKLTDVLCPNIDSKVVNMASADISTNMAFYVDVMTSVIFELTEEARQFGLDPIGWVLTGPNAAFRELTRGWPCVYNTVRCGTADALVAPPNINPELRQMQDDMYNNRYLMFDGVRIPFIPDDSIITSSVNNGNGTTTFTASLKLIPITSPVMTDSGGFITYKERYNFNTDVGGVTTQRAINELMPGGNTTAALLDGGTVLMLKQNDWECVRVKLIRYERLVMRATRLAARFDNITYTPRVVAPSPFPGTPGYNDAGFQISPVPTLPLA